MRKPLAAVAGATFGLVLVWCSARAMAGEPRWGREPVEELSRTRGRIVLNGVWQFLPAAGPAVKTPRGQWG